MEAEMWLCWTGKIAVDLDSYLGPCSNVTL